MNKYKFVGSSTPTFQHYKDDQFHSNLSFRLNVRVKISLPLLRLIIIKEPLEILCSNIDHKLG